MTISHRPYAISGSRGPLREAHAINFSWLLRLRWGAITGQTLVIGVAGPILHADLPLWPVCGIIAVEVVTNILCALWARRAVQVPEWALALVMALDVVLLTALLQLTGGPFNPFTALYLVNIALAAVVLQPAWTWSLTALSLASFGTLFVDRLGAPRASMHGPDHVRLHLEGMWLAFGVAAMFIVYFVQRVTRALSARDAELDAARRQTARSEKLASLATLAAGAAHQLATPLSTIAVVAKELERQLERQPASVHAAADARLIREQVERCRDILAQMAADAGESAGEPILVASLAEIVRAAIHGVAGHERIRLHVLSDETPLRVRVPRRALEQAVRGVLKNALEASPASSEVSIEVRTAASECCVEVRDGGVGMEPEVLARAGEPFFTTKGPDRGMGLGLFLARAVVERLGGRLQLDSRQRQGTRVWLTLPLETRPVRTDGTVEAAA